MSRNRIYLLCAGIGALGLSALYLYSISQSTSSTAPIGFLFVPAVAGIGAGLAAILVFLAFTGKDVARGKGEPRKIAVAAGVFIAIVLVAFVWRRETELLDRAKNPETNAAWLEEIYSEPILLRKSEIHEALAIHTATPAAILERMVEEGDYLAGLVGGNPSAPLTLLEKIASGAPSYHRHSGLARNPKLPRELAEKLIGVKSADFSGPTEYSLYQVYVLGALAKQENLPQDLFDRLAAWEDPEYFLVIALLYAPRISCLQLRRFLSYENQVIQNTAQGVFAKRKCLE